MNIVWQDTDDGVVTTPIEIAGTDEYFVLRATPQDDRFAWSVDYHEDPVEAPQEDLVTGTAPTLALAQRNAIGALMERLTGRRGRMVEQTQPLSVPSLPDLQDAMWGLYAPSGRPDSRQRANVDGWAKLAHQALVDLAEQKGRHGRVNR